MADFKYQAFSPQQELYAQLGILERQHFLASHGLSTAVGADGTLLHLEDDLGREIRRVRDLLDAYGTTE